MVAYGFKSFLVDPIERGDKIHTLRLPRKNPHPKRAHVGGHAMPGEEVQLYTRMRQPDCRLIGRSVCVRTIRATIEVVHSWVDLYETQGKKPRRLNCQDGSHLELDPFARSDGFESWKAFWDYWSKEVPREPGSDWQFFDGWLIEWQPLKTGGKRGRKK